MNRVLIGPATLAQVDSDYRSILESAGLELVFPRQKTQMTETELLDQLTGCVASLAGSEPYTRRVFERHPQLRIIARAGVGYDAIDLAAASDFGVPVAVSPGNSEGVAEHAIMLMLALAKSLIDQHTAIVAGDWPRRSVRPLRGQTLAILGLGRIGKALTLRARAMGLRVIAHDPVPDHDFARVHDVHLVSTEECFSRGDFVSLHYPLTAATYRGVGRGVLPLMKPTAYLVNTARGGLIDEAALLEALQSGRIAGAALDVLEHEPPPPDHPFRKLPNVVLTAHTAGVDTASRDAMARMAARTIVGYLAGEWPGDVIVNPESRDRAR